MKPEGDFCCFQGWWFFGSSGAASDIFDYRMDNPTTSLETPSGPWFQIGGTDSTASRALPETSFQRSVKSATKECSRVMASLGKSVHTSLRNQTGDRLRSGD